MAICPLFFFTKEDANTIPFLFLFRDESERSDVSKWIWEGGGEPPPPWYS